jgi:hypothetical protein
MRGPGIPRPFRADPLLRRLFRLAGQAAAFLLRAGLLIVWLQPHVSGFLPVLARGWHGARLSMRTTGGQAVQGHSGKSDGRFDLDRCSRGRYGCCTLVLHSGA